MLDKNLALARDMGAEVHALKGIDFVDAILSFAREQRITQLFLAIRGGPTALGWRVARSTG